MGLILKNKHTKEFIGEDNNIVKNILDARVFNNNKEILRARAKMELNDDWKQEESTVGYGWISYYNEEKGFGFVKSKSKSYYIHISKYKDRINGEPEKDMLVKFVFRDDSEHESGFVTEFKKVIKEKEVS